MPSQDCGGIADPATLSQREGARDWPKLSVWGPHGPAVEARVVCGTVLAVAVVNVKSQLKVVGAEARQVGTTLLRAAGL